MISKESKQMSVIEKQTLEIAGLKAELEKYRIIISRLLFSFNRHWIKMSLRNCSGTSPSEIAQSIVDAEEVLGRTLPQKGDKETEEDYEDRGCVYEDGERCCCEDCEYGNVVCEGKQFRQKTGSNLPEKGGE